MKISAFSATIMSIAYGIKITESEDPYIVIAEKAMSSIAEAGIPGTFLVDFFPILKHIPSWFPGAGFKKRAASAKVLILSLAEKPFSYVKDQLVRDCLLEIPQVCSGNDYSIEIWYGRAIRGSKPRRASS